MDNEEELMDNEEEQQKTQKAIIMKASYLLRSKVGFGDIDEEAIEKAQEIIEDFKSTDFGPLANEHMGTLDKLIKSYAKDKNSSGDISIEDIIAPVMQLKANAAMFNYDLVSRLADIMLNFPEEIDAIDDDVFDIMVVHQTALKSLIGNKITGDGSEEGETLQIEMKDACRRYFRKHHVKSEF